MKNKQGISLIGLIVTIIVIIILAAAVILTLNNNNPIDSSRVAQLADNRSSINSAINLYYGKKMAETQGTYDVKNIFIGKNNSDEAITGITALVSSTGIGDRYYTFNTNDNGTDQVKALLNISLPNITGATWYLDVDTGLVYLVFDNKDSVPNWMYTNSDKTVLDSTLSQFVRVKSSDGSSIEDVK